MTRCPCESKTITACIKICLNKTRGLWSNVITVNTFGFLLHIHYKNYITTYSRIELFHYSFFCFVYIILSSPNTNMRIFLCLGSDFQTTRPAYMCVCFFHYLKFEKTIRLSEFQMKFKNYFYPSKEIFSFIEASCSIFWNEKKKIKIL